MTEVHPHQQIHLIAIEHLQKAIIHHQKAVKYKAWDAEKGKARDSNHAAHHAEIALAHTLLALDKSHEAAKVEAAEYDKNAD